MSREPLARIDKLRIAGASAPALRRAQHRRPVNITNASGEVIGQIDHVELAKKLHERIGIEFDVEPGERDQVRTCRCGKVFVLPKKRDWRDHAGRLPKRCPTCRNAPCRVCGAEATPASKRRGDPETAVCAEHVSTGPSCKRPTPSCALCGKPAHSPAKSRFAASRGKLVYCEEHRGGLKAVTKKAACETCGKALSVLHARFCNEHKHDQRKKPRLPCTVCGAPSTQTTSAPSRNGRSLPYCKEHKGGTGRGQFRKGGKV